MRALIVPQIDKIIPVSNEQTHPLSLSNSMHEQSNGIVQRFTMRSFSVSVTSWPRGSGEP